MPVKNKEEEVSPPNRIKGARFLGGVWLAPDGTALTPQEAQQAHRAMDREASEARRRALLGGAT